MPFNPKNLVEIINKNKDKKLVASKIIESNPKVLPILPKLVANRDTSKAVDDNSRLNINKQLLETIYNKVKSTKQNNKNIIKLFPDIELSIQILVSSILSPKKMTDIQLNYKLNKNFTIESTAISNILENLKTYINDEYEIEDKLPEILREALFNSGAYPFAIIPESAVDDVINTDLLASYSTEEFKQRSDIVIHNLVKPINILNSSANRKVPLATTATKQNFIEHLASESFVNITDNVSILRFNSIKEKINKSLISNSLKRNIAISQESIDKLNYLDIFRQKNSTTSEKDVEFIKTKTETKRKSIGKPMTIKLPTESVIPIFIPGNETEHIGYFVLLDETGKPLNTELKENNVNQLGSILSGTNQSSQTPVQKAYNNLVQDSQNTVDLNQLFDLYKDVLEKQIYNSVKNSLYGSNVDIANKNDIYFLMFTRALSEQRTNILYIPKELMVYFAFYYNELGIGKSLLENLSVLSSLRAIILFSKVMAQAKQSIDVTKVNISLDPNDPDPEKTIEQVQDSVLKLRQNYFPLGINNPVDLINWIQRAGLQFSYENNPLLPNIKIDFENANLQHTVPNSELEEDLRKQTILALGLSPETIDNGFSPEFATTIVNNNILLSKRIAIYQKALMKHLSKMLGMLIYNDEELRNILRKEIMDNIDSITQAIQDDEKALYTKSKEEFIEYFIDKLGDSVYIELPKPENTNITNLSAEFDLYKENLEKVLDSVVSTEIFSENISGELSGHIDTIKNIYKHFLLRKWCSDNNFIAEALDISDINKEEVDSMLGTINTHLGHTMRNSSKLMNIVQKFKDATAADLEKINGESSTSSMSSSGSSDSNSDDTGSGGDDLGGSGGDDDFGLSGSDTDLTL